jgi:peptidoglycan/xylan/chitin deacetylase (PgdA/CDA1 family)
VTVDALLAARQGGPPLPRRPVVLTFDDAFQACVDHALPLLEARGWPATFYMVTGCAGQPAAWLRAQAGAAWTVMDWAAARRVEGAGSQCGAHSLTHARLSDLSHAACRYELREGQRRLEDALGRAVHHLAYPYGAYNETVRALATECGFKTAMSTRSGLSGATDDVLALHRVPVNGQESLLDFIARLNTGQTWRAALLARRPGQRRPAPRSASVEDPI